ncbi:MAG TPA: MFS transporter [Candidatus Saccharimonadales bacterium]|nr:MFS transporter [Candidatus Saccharimonadales bacterium]
MNGRRNRLLAIAAAAVLIAAVDTYVIVLALPAIMSDVGLGIDQLQAATPIISGFLLGYVVVMPLLGRLSDVYGRRPLLLLCLAIFAAGSLVTASAHDLGSVVAGRALQGLGGGGLVPVTLGLVADVWPAERRGVPLGVIGAVQELGSVLGPLYGGVILTVATWQTIFWLNLPIAAVLGLGLVAAGREAGAAPTPRRSGASIDRVSIAIAAVALAAGCLAIVAPEPLQTSDTLGVAYSAIGGVVWLTPLALVAIAAALALLLWEFRGTGTERPLIDVRHLPALATAVDWPGAALLGVALATVIVSFSAEDPTSGAVSPAAIWLLPVGAVAVVLFVIRERAATRPLLAAGELRSRGAYGALLTNLAIGAALMAALLDVPVLARATVFPSSQLGAALVLLRLLVGVPIGAVAGGWLSQRVGNRSIAAAGMVLTAASFAAMTSWTATTLADPLGPGWLHPSDPVLFVCGIGFGLSIAPVNGSMLVSVRDQMHGLASALVVVARMIGMLVGISILTAVSLHVFYTTAAALPAPQTLCPSSPLNCAAYEQGVTGAIVTELHSVFLGAGICAAIAAIFAALFLRSRPAQLRPALP